MQQLPHVQHAQHVPHVDSEPPATAAPHPAAATLLAFGMASQPLSFVVGLRSSAARVETADAPRLVRRMLAEYGRSQMLEWYHDTTVAKIVFDVDGTNVGDLATTPPDLLRDALAGVDAFFAPLPRPHLTIAQSHGGAKVSFRIFADGHRMTIADQKARLAARGLDNRHGGPFDAAIYSKNQKLRMVGSIKTPQDARVLALCDLDGAPVQPTADLLLATLVQVVDDAWPLLAEAPPARAPRAHAPPADLQVAPAPKRARGRPPRDETIAPDDLRALLAMGFRDPKFISATPEGFVFDAHNRDACPNCAHDHDRNNWWCIPKEDDYMVSNYSQRCTVKRYPRAPVEAIVPAHANFEQSLALLPLDESEAAKLLRLHYHDKVIKVACFRPECLACERRHDCTTYTASELLPHHCWTMRNDDNSCRPRIFHHTARLADKLHSLFTSPNEESLLGLFLEGHAGTIHVDRASNAVFLWATEQGGGGRWRRLTSNEFESHISMWLNALLSGVAGLAEFKDHDKALRQAQGKVTPAGVTKLKAQIQGRVSLQAMQAGRDVTMDANPYLLGVGASVVDLKARDPTTGAFSTCLRHARPEDLITRSVGYDIPEDGLEDASGVEAVFAQIYPVEEERRFFQLYGGYCLLGNNLAKGFLCLTDRRKGDNGKSTAVQLLRRALGADYVIDNKQNLLYEARYSTNVNAHDSGMLAFEGKRLAIMEELSANKTLDTSVMKQLTGGETHISVRAAGAAETRAMAWSAKLVTVFNEGCVPKFKVEDDAFTKRMIVMPHRAFFCKDDAARAAHAGEDYTYDADGSKIEALQPWHILAWLLQGLQRYWASGQVEFCPPPACREWAGDIVSEQDALRVWLDEHLEIGEDHEFVTKKDIEVAARDGGVLVTQQALRKKLEGVFGCGGAQYKLQHYVDGIRYSSAWMRLRWR